MGDPTDKPMNKPTDKLIGKPKKIVLVGDGGVGKTTLMNLHTSGKFEPRYEPTIGVEASPLSFLTNRGKITFNCWDTAGQEKYGGLRDGYYIQADGCIVMFSLDSRVSFRNTTDWLRNFWRVVGYRKPLIVLCGNKSDIEDRKVSPDDVAETVLKWRQSGLNVDYCETSMRRKIDYEKPFLALAKSFVGDDVEFTFN